MLLRLLASSRNSSMPRSRVLLKDSSSVRMVCCTNSRRCWSSGKNSPAVSQHIDELVEKRFLKTQRAPVTHSAPKDAAQHVVAIVVAWQNAVGNGEAQRADVIADHAKGDVDLFLFVRFAVRQCGGVSFAAELFEFSKNGAEDVRIVIGNRLGEVGKVLCGLNDGSHALEAMPVSTCLAASGAKVPSSLALY